MVNVVEDLVAQGALVQDDEHWTLQEEGATIERSVPENIRQLMEQQVERLSRAAAAHAGSRECGRDGVFGGGGGGSASLGCGRQSRSSVQP